jgi:formate dehydrogenase subunit gamma
VASFSSWDREQAEALVAPLAGMAGALLPMLHRLQDTYGYIHPEAVPLLAELLNLSRAEVHGVVTFYRDFRQSPPGRHLIEMCRAESCQSVQGEAVLAHLCERLGLEPGQTAADGSVTLREVYCLGHCAASPAAMIDHEPHGRLTAAAVDRLLADLDQHA